MRATRPGQKICYGLGPAKIFFGCAGFFPEKIWCERDRPGKFFFTNRFCREFFSKPEQLVRTHGCVWWGGTGPSYDWADPGPDLVPDPFSIAGTGGTEERWQSAGKIITITEITNQKNPDFSLKKGIFSSNIPQLPPALSQTTHQNPEPRASGGPKKPATDL